MSLLFFKRVLANPIRVGYIYDSGRGIHYITAGVGFVQPE